MPSIDSEVYYFRPWPGPRERQLKRRYRNPLFGEAGARLSQAEVDAARAADLAELNAFTEALRALVEEAMALPARADSEVILRLEERCDQLYEQCAGLGGELTAEREAIKRLTHVVMKAVWRGAGNDTVASAELEQQDSARAQHYALLGHALIADLLRPDTLVPPDELVPTLLSEDEAAVRAAMGLFEPHQRQAIVTQARGLLAQVKGHARVPARAERALAAMEATLGRQSQI
jgi:hypothetical protein